MAFYGEGSTSPWRVIGDATIVKYFYNVAALKRLLEEQFQYISISFQRFIFQFYFMSGKSHDVISYANLDTILLNL